MDPSRNWPTNSLMRLRPRSLAATSAPKRPSWTIWSNSPVVSTVWPAGEVGVPAVCGSAIGRSLLAHFALQLLQLLRISDRLEQQFLQLIVPLQAPPQI